MCLYVRSPRMGAAAAGDRLLLLLLLLLFDLMELFAADDGLILW